MNYIGLSNAGRTAGEPSSVRQIDVSAALRPARFWEFGMHHAHDLSEEGGPLRSGLWLQYGDECLTATLEVDRRFTRQRDVADTTEFLFRIKLRNLD